MTRVGGGGGGEGAFVNVSGIHAYWLSAPSRSDDIPF